MRYTKKTVIAAAVTQLVLVTGGAAYAQTTPSKNSELGAVVVTGQRAALESAQNIKKNADEMVDSIVADDIGKLPDRSVIEVLQRIPGITLDRAMTKDPQHYSVEGNSAAIRGLSFVRSELNGRDSFSANGGRALNFEDVPPELMSGVDVYKNPSASQIEGGISGIVNLRTALPFDFKGFKGAISADTSYSTLVGRSTPSGSLMLSNRWATDFGEVGLLVDLADSKSATRADQMTVDPYHPRTDIDPGQTRWITKGVSWRSQDLDRDRKGQYVAAQWKPNADVNTSLTYFKSAYNIEWSERFISMQAASADKYKVDNPVWGANGALLKGTLTVPSENGINFNPAHRVENRDSDTTEVAWKLQWNLTPSLTLKTDLQRITARTDGFASEIGMGYLVPKQNVDLTGGIAKVNWDSGDLANMADPGKSYWAYTMDHNDKATAAMNAFKADLEYTFEHPVLRDIQFGVRTTNRTSSTYQELPSYNWQGVSQPWMLGWNIPKLAFLSDPRFNPGPNSVNLFKFDNFMGGSAFAPSGFYASNDYIRSVNSSYDQLHGYHDILCQEQKAAQGWGDCAQWGTPGYKRAAADPKDPNSGISEISETTQAFYTQLRFGFDDWKFPVDGNVGVRYVRTSNQSDGGTVFTSSGINFPPGSVVTGLQIPNIPDFKKKESFENTYTNVLPSLNLRMKAAKDLQFRFAYGESMFRPDFSQLQGYTSLSRNVKITTDPNTNTSNIDSVTLTGDALGNPKLKPTTSKQFDLSAEWYFGSASSLTFAVFDKQLRDIVVNQSFNYSIPDSTGKPSTFSVTGPVNGASGVARGFELAYQQYYDNVPAWLKGIGVQASYTYVDSSRSLYDSVNSKYCASGGTADNGDSANNAGNSNLWNNGCDTDGTTFGDLPLQGLSRQTINFAVMYESGPISARIAYNWRSRYLESVRDSWGTRQNDGLNTNPADPGFGKRNVYYALPLWGEAYGQVDASVFYKVTKDFTVGMEVQNLTNSIFRQTMQQHIGDMDHAWVASGPRYSFHARYSF